MAASGLCGQYALTHRTPDTWHEHHTALHEGDQHDVFVGQDDVVGQSFADEGRIGVDDLFNPMLLFVRRNNTFM